MTPQATETPARRDSTTLFSTLSAKTTERSPSPSPVDYHQRGSSGGLGLLQSAGGVSMATPTDCDLIRRAQMGDRQAFDQLLLRHQGVSWKLITHHIFAPEDREDVWQDAALIAWKSIGKFNTRKYKRYGPFLGGATVLAIRRYLAEKGEQAQANQVLKEALEDPEIVFVGGGSRRQATRADHRILSAEECERLIREILGAGVPPHQLLAFLLVKVLDENPAAAAGEPDRNAVRKIVDQYWDDPFWKLKGVFIDAYIQQHGSDPAHVRNLFKPLDAMLRPVEDDTFAKHSDAKADTEKKRAQMTGWWDNARKTIIKHLAQEGDE